MTRNKQIKTTMVEAETSDTAVGDTITMDGPSYYVRLPDGSVVTARSEYTFRQPGDYVLINAGDGTEKTVHVRKDGS